jgi:single-stranded DNA-binding protein
MLPTVQIIGNLNYLETKVTQSGKKVTSFVVECSEKNSRGEWENLNIRGEVWEKSSDFVNQYFKNGDVAVVNGKLVTNAYQKQDGSKSYSIKLLFPTISFPPKAKDNSNSNGNGANNYNQQQNNQNHYQQQNQPYNQNMSQNQNYQQNQQQGYQQPQQQNQQKAYS